MSTKAHVRFLIVEIVLVTLAIAVMFQRLNSQMTRIEAIESVLQAE